MRRLAAALGFGAAALGWLLLARGLLPDFAAATAEIHRPLAAATLPTAAFAWAAAAGSRPGLRRGALAGALAAVLALVTGPLAVLAADPPAAQDGFGLWVLLVSLAAIFILPAALPVLAATGALFAACGRRCR
ncbi:hypothetical protein [Zavarzinia compransoris]|nr:hypothetical protein [Zavarzinia compransoris]